MFQPNRLETLIVLIVLVPPCVWLCLLFFSWSFRSLHSTEGIFGLPGWNSMKNIFLETLWVSLFMIKILLQNLTNFVAKFGSKVEICWKSAGYIGNYWIIRKFQVVCWDIYYFSERLWCQLYNKPQKSKKLALCKNFCEEQNFEGSKDCP
jgi:hypothetical protein